MDFLKTIPFSTGCQIIATHPCGLIAINKKAGRASHPNKNPSKNDKPSMIRAKYNFRDEYYSWIDDNQQKQHLYLVNRLDSPTSGVILAATTPEIAELAKEQFRNKLVDKKYMAIVVGKVFPNTELWKNKLSTQNSGKFVRSNTSKDSSGKIAITRYKVECFDENNAKLSLIRLEPQTGLTHQLRVQCALHRYPILGDATYGNFAVNKKMKSISKINRLFLHCLSTSLKFDVDGKTIEFFAEAPLPESFNKIIRYNNQIKKHFF
ncbi:MAG: RNA pseudouridine synthase [Verrucomicrobiaceae bacterium]|jgi:23S rRNA-/tRNA-specific pseudouridylate synthase|nr:RNA pseudouridine synthase [Verrucomicrobiaceae bacterium]